MYHNTPFIASCLYELVKNIQHDNPLYKKEIDVCKQYLEKFPLAPLSHPGISIFFNVLQQRNVTRYVNRIAAHRICMKDVYQLLVICGIDFSPKIRKTIDKHCLRTYGPLEMFSTITCLDLSGNYKDENMASYLKLHPKKGPKGKLSAFKSTMHRQKNLICLIAKYLQRLCKDFTKSYASQNYVTLRTLFKLDQNAHKLHRSIREIEKLGGMALRWCILIRNALKGRNAMQRRALIRWANKTKYLFPDTMASV